MLQLGLFYFENLEVFSEFFTNIQRSLGIKNCAALLTEQCIFWVYFAAFRALFWLMNWQCNARPRIWTWKTFRSLVVFLKGHSSWSFDFFVAFFIRDQRNSRILPTWHYILKKNASSGIRTQVATARGSHDWPDYTNEACLLWWLLTGLK